MKSTKIKRLSLNKKTIANLNNVDMRSIFAGQLDEQQQEPLQPVNTFQPGCVISTYTYYTCPPWSCGLIICAVPVQDLVK